MLIVHDDSGFLALIVPATYQSFVAENWDFGLLRSHFRRQMGRRSMLIWGTGLEGSWRVDLRFGGPDVQGFRGDHRAQFMMKTAQMMTTKLRQYSPLAAQFVDVLLPQAHERDQLIELPDGDYTCRVVQMFDPNARESAEGESADFVVALSPSTGSVQYWSDIPWFADP